MRSKKTKSIEVARESGQANENAYPHCPFNKWFGPAFPGTILTYSLEKIKEEGQEGIQARQDRVRRHLRNNNFRDSPFAYTYEDAIRAAGMDIERDGQVDWIAHRGYQTDQEPKNGGKLRQQIHLEGAGSVQRLQEVLEITGLDGKTDTANEAPNR